jgi:hypothetical protein
MTDLELEQQVQDFAEHRAETGKPMSSIAVKHLRTRALRLRAAGVNLQESFDRAILNGWLSIYEPKEDQVKKPQSHKEAILPNWQAGSKELAHSNIAQLRRIVK